MRKKLERGDIFIKEDADEAVYCANDGGDERRCETDVGGRGCEADQQTNPSRQTIAWRQQTPPYLFSSDASQDFLGSKDPHTLNIGIATLEA